MVTMFWIVVAGMLLIVELHGGTLFSAQRGSRSDTKSPWI